jgi:hypothetical protein
MQDTQLSEESSMGELMRPSNYRERPEVARVFQSDASLLWFLRRYRRRLLQAGAIAMIANRTYLRPSIVDRVVLEVGIETARGEVTADAS